MTQTTEPTAVAPSAAPELDAPLTLTLEQIAAVAAGTLLTLAATSGTRGGRRPDV